MAWIKRIFLFGAVNLLVLVTITILLRGLGVQPYLNARGIDYRSLMAFCLVWGMGGAFVSLGLSRVMAKWMMGVQVIDPATASGDAQSVLRLVHSLAERAGLPALPEVGIYQSPELNAFATGPTKSRALVAVSSGLLSAMNGPELEGVLGHELTHVANGDMVTMTLLQGVINAFVMFLAQIAAFAVSAGVNEESRGTVQFLITIVLEIVLSLLGTVVVA
ncbi:MAG TPA: M48 family metalloprotease, partial [Elusimicrobiota bacterium]|nr:M48 family metalloprotease [Elusimicrobiota bacterium]